MQRPQAEMNRPDSASDRVAQIFLSVNPSGYSLPSTAFTGQAFTHCMHCVHRGFSITGSGGISAVVKIEANRTLIPNFSVSTILFMPKFLKTCKAGSMAVREKGNRFIIQDADRPVTIPGDPDRGETFSIKE
jgi:hypothetical protein